MKKPQLAMVLLAGAFCCFAPKLAKGETCFFIEVVGIVCSGDESQQFEWESTDYFDLVCVGGPSGSGGGAGGLSAAQRRALEDAMTLAMLKLEQEQACQDMYETLGFPSAQGDILLMTTHYASGQGSLECAFFPRSMYTAPGSGQVSICPQWHNQPLTDQTLILLHESLHTAGALETPSNGLGYPSSDDYSGFVRTRCDV